MKIEGNKKPESIEIQKGKKLNTELINGKERITSSEPNPRLPQTIKWNGCTNWFVPTQIANYFTKLLSKFLKKY